jgi:outer membrane protein assembly factor BamB
MKVVHALVVDLGRSTVNQTSVGIVLRSQPSVMVASIFKAICLALLMALLMASIVPATSVAQPWPQWRGANFDSVADGQDLPVEFGSDKNLRWKLKLPGAAGASPVVAGDRIFLTTQVGDAGLALLCVSTSGKQLWQHQFDRPNQSRRMDNANAASPSPVTDGQHVWAVMGTGEVRCLTVEGELVWKFDLQDELGKFKMLFGYATSPVMANGKLYVVVIDGNMRSRDTSEGKIFCLDAKTGNKDWVHVRPTDGYAENLHAYTSPVVCKSGDREVLLVHGADYLTAHALDDGKEIWRSGGLNPQGENYHRALRFVASPGVGAGKVIVPSAKNGPMACIDLKATHQAMPAGSVEMDWQQPTGTPDVSTPLIYRGVVYLATTKGLLAAHDLSDGSQLYRQRLVADKHRSTPVASDGKIYLVGRDGTVAVVKAGTELEVLAKNKLQEEATASPAIAEGVIYIRTWKTLYAFGKPKK